MNVSEYQLLTIIYEMEDYIRDHEINDPVILSHVRDLKAISVNLTIEALHQMFVEMYRDDHDSIKEIERDKGEAISVFSLTGCLLCKEIRDQFCNIKFLSFHEMIIENIGKAFELFRSEYEV